MIANKMLYKHSKLITRKRACRVSFSVAALTSSAACYPCVGVSGVGEVRVGDSVDEDGEAGGAKCSVAFFPSFSGDGGEEHHPLQREEREEKKARKKGRRRGLHSVCVTVFGCRVSASTVNIVICIHSTYHT